MNGLSSAGRSVLVLGVVLVGFAGWRLWPRAPAMPPYAAALPAVPDLQRWPRELQHRVLAATATAAAADPHEGVRALGELAQLYFANGYSPEADRILALLVSADPANGRWPYLLGILKERTDDRAAAEKLFAAAARLDPDYAPALIHQANLLGQLGQAEAAGRILEQCLALPPPDPRVSYGLAKLDFVRGDERSAIRRLQAAVLAFPQYQEAHLMLADLLAKAGDVRQAAEQRAFLYGGETSPPDRDPWMDTTNGYCYDSFRLQSLGSFLNLKQDFAGALPLLQRAATLEPRDADINEALARSLMGLHRWEEARLSLLAALRADGSNDQLNACLAEVLLAENKGDGALALLREARRQRPASAVLANAEGTTCQTLGLLPEAIATYEEAIRLDPVFVEPQLNLADCYLKADDPQQARTWAERALKLRPEAAEGRLTLVAACLRINDIDDALAAARILYQHGMNVAETRAIYAQVLLRAGNLAAERGEHDQAEAYYREGLAADERSGSLHGALGMLWGKLRRFPEAQAELEIFVRLEPRNPIGYVLLGSVFRAENKPDEARQTWSSGLNVATEVRDSARISQLRQLLGE